MVWLIAEDYMSDKLKDDVAHWKEIVGLIAESTCLMSSHVMWLNGKRLYECMAHCRR